MITKLPKKVFNFLSLVIVVVLAAANSSSVVIASPQDDLAAIQKQIQDVKNQKNNINNQINSEKNKEGQYNNEIRGISRERDLIEQEIKEKELTIQELNLQIEILTTTISDTEKVIEKTKSELVDLEAKADVQLKEMYLDLKTHNSGLSLIFTDGGVDFVKQGVYQKTIQNDTNSSLAKLEQENEKLKADKEKLQADQQKVLLDKESLDLEKIELDKKKSELQTKINQLNSLRNEALKSIDGNKKILSSLSDQEAKLLADQELLQQQIFNQVNSMPNGTFVRKGTIIGYQGLTGLTTGYHVHFMVAVNGSLTNPCGYIPAGRFGNCAGNGALGWPLSGTFYYTSGYGPRNLGGGTSSFHYAIDLAHPTQNAPVYATHDGWYTRGFSPCSGSLCKGGGANYVTLCENKSNCNSGFKTQYWHLK